MNGNSMPADGHVAASGITERESPLGSLWRRSRKKFFGDRHNASKNVTPPDQVESKKAAHARRREQVQRAQRNHRERKAKYLQHLERQLELLQTEQNRIAADCAETAVENEILKDILMEHGLFLSQEQSPKTGPIVVSVIGEPGFGQRFRVNTNSNIVDTTPIFPPDFAIPEERRRPSLGFVQRPSLQVSTKIPGVSATSPSTESSTERNSPTAFQNRYSHFLDAPEAGIEFILFLERCCLQHLRSHTDPEEIIGHELNIYAPLLVGAPPELHHGTEWQISPSQLERLFELSDTLDLTGEITPVQVWNRIRYHPKFHRLRIEILQEFSLALIEEVQCFGFGAVIDERTCDILLDVMFKQL